MNIDGAENRRKLFDHEENLNKEDPQSKELIFADEENNFEQEKTNNYDQDIFDLSQFYQKESIIKYSSQEQSKKLVEESPFVDSQEMSKQLDQSQSLSKSIIVSPISRQIKRENKQGIRFSTRKVTKRESHLIHNLISKQNGQSIWNRKQQSSERLEQSNFAMINLGKDEKENEPQNIKLVTFSYTYKFLKKLFLQYISKEIRFLTTIQRNIINDKAAYLGKTQENDRKEVTTQKYKNIFDRLSYLRNNQTKVNEQKKYRLINYAEGIIAAMILFSKILNKTIKIIKPNYILLKIWDLIFIAHQFSIFIFYPFYFSFYETPYNSQLSQMMLSLQKIQLTSTCIDILLTQHTGIYVFGEIVLNRSQIYKDYYQKNLFQDLLCLLFLIYGICTAQGLPCFFSLIIRLGQMRGKCSKMNWYQKIKSKFSSYYDLVMLAFSLLLLIHLFGCGFYYTGVVSSRFDEMNWIKQSKITDKSLFTKYIYSIYFTTITMVTIGYGDITPTNTLEIIYTIFVSFISCGLFGYCINLIGSILTEISKKSKEFQKKQEIITRYLSSRNIQYSLQNRVLKYLEYLDESQEENILEGLFSLIIVFLFLFVLYNIQGQKILQSCSIDIREDILKEYFGRVLKQSRIIKDTFSKDFVESLSLKMQERTFAPGEVIIERGQQLKYLYFVTKGQTEYFLNKLDQKKSIYDLMSNKDKLNLFSFEQIIYFPRTIKLIIPFQNVFVQFEIKYENPVIDVRIFMSQQSSDISIRSKGITIVSYFDHETFVDILKQYQIDYEKFIQLRDQFLNDQRFQYSCKSCGQFKHNLFDCPQLSYQVDKCLNIKKYVLSNDQQRNSEHNRNQKKFQSLMLNLSIKKSVKIIRYDIVRNLYDGFDDLQENSKFFEGHDDKEFFLLLPKINSQKLIDNYKAMQEDHVIEFNTQPKQFQSEGLINIKFQNMDDVLEFTNSESSSYSDQDKDSSSEESFDFQRKFSKKSIKSNTSIKSQKEKYLFVESTLHNDPSSEVAMEDNGNLQSNNKNIQNNNLTDVKHKSAAQFRDQYNVQQSFQQQQQKFIMSILEDKHLQLESDIKKELNDSVHSSNNQDKNSSQQSDYKKLQDNNNLNTQNLIQLKQNLIQLIKDDQNKMQKSNTSELQSRREGIRHKSLIRNNSNLGQAQISTRPCSNSHLSSEPEDVHKVQFEKIQTLKDYETFKRDRTRHQTLDNKICSQLNLQSTQQINQIEYIKLFIEMIEQKQNQQHGIKSNKDKIKSQNSTSSKHHSKKINNQIMNQYSLQPPQSHQLFPREKNVPSYLSQFSSVKASSNSQNTKLASIIKHSNLHIEQQNINTFNINAQNDCLFGKCGLKFDFIKEYEHYYPKFNYTYVIKAFRKQNQYYNKQIKSLQLKKNQSQKALQPIPNQRQQKQTIYVLNNKKEYLSTTSFS